MRFLFGVALGVFIAKPVMSAVQKRLTPSVERRIAERLERLARDLKESIAPEAT